MRNGRFRDYLARKQREHGERFDPSGLVERFRDYYGTGRRIRVRRTYPDGTTHERTGTVGATTGWAPAFLLMHRRTDTGSSDVLGPEDVIVAVHDGRRYVPVPGRE